MSISLKENKFGIWPLSKWQNKYSPCNSTLGSVQMMGHSVDMMMTQYRIKGGNHKL